MATSHSDRTAGMVTEPVADHEEAAAIIAAIRFALDESAGRDRTESDRGDVDPWLRAARFEAVRGTPARVHPDTHPNPWVAFGRTEW